MSDLATIGFKAETSGLTKAQAELNKTAAAGSKVDKSLVNMAKSTSAADKKMANISRRFGMAGIQFQQFIGQIQGGQSAMVALSQQSADLGFVLGAPLLGAVTGISASLVGMLLPSLMSSKNAMSLLEETNERLKLSLGQTSDGVDVLSESLLKLAGKSEALALLQISSSIEEAEKIITISATGIEDALDDAFSGNVESMLRDFSDDLSTAAMKTTGSMDDIKKALASGDFSTIGGGAQLSDSLRVFSEQMDITRPQAIELGLAISNAFDEQSPQNIKALENTLADLNIEVGGSNKKINALATELIPLFDATSDGITKVNKLRQAFGNFGKQAETDSKEAQALALAITGVSASLEGQIIALRDGEQAALEYNIAQSLGLKTTEEIPAALQAQINKIYDLKAAQEASTQAARDKAALDKLVFSNSDIKKYYEEIEAGYAKEERSLESLTDKINNFGGAWSETGSVVVDAFGDMSDSLNDHMKRMKELSALQSDLDKQKASGIDTTELQAKLDQESMQAQISGYGDLAGAAASMFSEKTAAYRAFHAIEMTLKAVEIAMAIKQAAVDVAAGGAKMFSQSGWAGFAGVAAMTAAMASLGFSSGGGSSGMSIADIQESQSTGSVYGDLDAKSESLLNSSELIADISVDQLSELVSISNAMSGIADGIADVGAISQAIGGENLTELRFVNLGTVSTKSDSVTGSGSTGAADPSLTRAVQSVFVGARLALSEAAQVLGVGVASDIEKYVYPSFVVNLEDLDADASQEEINAAFSNAIDNMAAAMVEELSEFQDVGEGLFETVVRLSSEQAIFNDHLGVLGTSLSDLSSIMQIEVAQGVIDAIGGFDEFSDAAESFVDNFFTDAEQFAMLETSLTDIFDELGVGLVNSTEGFRDLLSGIDITTEAGQSLYASLLAINPELSDYIDYLEDEQDAAKEAKLSVLEDEQSMLESIISNLTPAAETTAATIESALAAARNGDFTLASALSPTDVSADLYSSSSEYALAQAAQDAKLLEIAQLAELELTDTQYEISLLEDQNVILAEINENIINQALIGGESNQATQTASVAESSEQMAATQEEVKYMTESMTRNIAEMRSDINQIKNGGLSVYTLGDDTVATTSV